MLSTKEIDMNHGQWTRNDNVNISYRYAILEEATEYAF